MKISRGKSCWPKVGGHGHTGESGVQLSVCAEMKLIMSAAAAATNQCRYKS